METQELLNRWEELLDEPGNAAARRGVLQERVDILHRLNELGIKEIDGRPLVKPLEEANASLREMDGASK
jgi:hypothetical protein